jgi:hypothetical protein
LTASTGFLDLREYLAGVAEGVDGGRDAAVDRDLEEDFADLFARDGVGERALDVG